MPDIVCNIFSALSTTEQGAATTFTQEDSRIETIDVAISLQQVGERRELYTCNVERERVDLTLMLR